MIRNGCLVCRSRRIKCDEGRPSCERCLKRGRDCKYTDSATKRLNTGIPRTPTESLLDSSKFPLCEHDFQFYYYVGAPTMAQWASPQFWFTTFPAASGTSSVLRCALLAVSTTIQQFTNTSPDAIRRMEMRGSDYYGQACLMMRPGSRVTLEEALNTSIALWNHDFFFGQQSRSYIHVNAAVKLFQSLKNYNDVDWPSTLGRESRRSLLSVAQALFNDIHFPVENHEFLKMLERRARHASASLPERDAINDTIDDAVIPEDSFDEFATPERICSFFWPIVVAKSNHVLHTIQRALDRCARHWEQASLPRSRNLEIFNNQIRILQVFCRLHICVEIDDNGDDTDDLMSELLDLIEINVQMKCEEMNSLWSKDQNNLKLSLSQEGVHCYLGILSYIAKRAVSYEVRDRAFDQIASHCSSKG